MEDASGHQQRLSLDRCTGDNMSVSISSVSFEHHHEAFGIGEASPRISWRYEGSVVNWEQTGYEIEITRDGVPRIFGANSSASTLVSWPDEPLTSSESAMVRARAYGTGLATDWSDTVSVEAALLDGDWTAALPIAADRETEVNATHKPILFRKAFGVNSTVASARLYITGLGIYEAQINGRRVGDHVLAPGYMSYQFRHTYDTYDVTNFLKNGDNAIGVTVGEGWWSGKWRSHMIIQQSYTQHVQDAGAFRTCAISTVTLLACLRYCRSPTRMALSSRSRPI